MKLKELKQIILKGGDKKTMKTKIKQEKGITLIALVVTIVVLLILAGVSVNALFGNSGLIEKAKEAQNKMNQATQKDLDAVNSLNEWLESKTNGSTGEDDNPSTTPKISTLVGTVVEKNTKAEDAYGNKITIPKGFKVLAHGTEAGSANYTYSGDNIPAVQDGIVIEDTQTETDASSYASKNKSTSFSKTGINNDKYCNIWDMSGNTCEWTTEYSTVFGNGMVDLHGCRGGFYISGADEDELYTSNRVDEFQCAPPRIRGLRPLLYVK